MPTFGSLFTGIGGLDLGLERAGWECRWQVELDDYCRTVLTRHWPTVPKMADVRDFPGLVVEEPVDLICGGFPCQPVSSAGKRLVQADPRWLWPEFARIVGELRPRFVLVENVADLVVRGLGEVLGDLSRLGFDAEWSSLSACALGSPHPRRRLFLVAYAQGNDEQDQGSHHPFEDRGLADWQGQPRGDGGDALRRPRWLPEPPVDRVADGVPRRLVRAPLSALGNAVVPQVAEWLGTRIIKEFGLMDRSDSSRPGGKQA